MVLKQSIIVVILSSLFFSCDDILELEDISAKEVQILAPKEGSIINTNDVNFNWEKVDEATAYRIQIAKPNFENAIQIVLDTFVEQDSLGYVVTGLQKTLSNGFYQWRIKASNAGFETDFFTFGFEVQGDASANIAPLNKPVLRSLSYYPSQDETAVAFSWTLEDVSDTAERDHICIYTNENGHTLVLKGLRPNKTFATTLF